MEEKTDNHYKADHLSSLQLNIPFAICCNIFFSYKTSLHVFNVLQKQKLHTIK